jgi:hypothetical protein
MNLQWRLPAFHVDKAIPVHARFIPLPGCRLGLSLNKNRLLPETSVLLQEVNRLFSLIPDHGKLDTVANGSTVYHPFN